MLSLDDPTELSRSNGLALKAEQDILRKLFITIAVKSVHSYLEVLYFLSEFIDVCNFYEGSWHLTSQAAVAFPCPRILSHHSKKNDKINVMINFAEH